MKHLIPKVPDIRLVLMLITLVLIYGCTQMSELISDKDAGLNGSFEITKSGLPVNWLVYTPRTIPEGDYDLIIDTMEYKEGKQSLKFLVRECSPVGGWYSPGFCNEYTANPGEIFRISFWIKNHESEFIIRIGGVSASRGAYDTIVKSKDATDNWKLFDYYYTIPENMKAIRFEMNILQPGTFWIDDIKITKVDSIK
jgi:hypothetical protein